MTPHTADRPFVDTLQVVFKVAERCNIDCDYCYYFNMGDTRALARPPVVDPDRAEAVGQWIAQGCQDLGIEKVLVSFHGGEPMLLKPRIFDRICASLRAAIEPHASLGFAIQTNGTILSPAWLEAFSRHRVHVGVSIDGDRLAHDRHRLDKRGRSTFAKTRHNLERLVAWSAGERGLGPSTISVLDWRNDLCGIYRGFREMGIREMSFLLPDRSRDDGFTGEDETAAAYGQQLADVFEAWLKEDDASVFVRQIDRTLARFRLGGPMRSETVQIVVVQSDGSIALNDSYIPALSWYRKLPQTSVDDTPLRDHLTLVRALEAKAGLHRLPSRCEGCAWASLCRGGDVENRYSRDGGFDNPSAYCEGYQVFYARVRDLLVANGYPQEVFETRLEGAA
ncbi:radical SAM protein [Stappia sp. ES.058]|uniref:radical SAM protein n=1 Tax=Stappia sp. ES.058 TaxID=1881061 RepID=UPI00087961DB|nr:radical SAM protein [Stappia sp. ES.058]SDU00628.1 uncharacterized protein SAMN05428979_1060 [Stappia sp. ES.058]